MNGTIEIGKPVVILTDNSFSAEVLSSAKPVLVDFWAPWCGPCRMIGPVVEELATKYHGPVVVGKVNVDENPHVASQFGITSIPTLLFFKNGKVADQVFGVVSAKTLTAKLDALL